LFGNDGGKEEDERKIGMKGKSEKPRRNHC